MTHAHPSVSDQSRSAVETEGFDPKDESAVTAGQTPVLPPPVSAGELETALEWLQGEAKAFNTAAEYAEGSFSKEACSEQAQRFEQAAQALQSLQQKNENAEAIIRARDEQLTAEIAATRSLAERFLEQSRALQASQAQVHQLTGEMAQLQRFKWNDTEMARLQERNDQLEALVAENGEHEAGWVRRALAAEDETRSLQQKLKEAEAEKEREIARISEDLSEADWVSTQERRRAASAEAQLAEAQGYSDILMSVCAMLELPRSESGPCTDVSVYDRAIEGLQVDLAKTEAERVEHMTARFKAESTVEQMAKALEEKDAALKPFADKAERYDESPAIVIRDCVELWQLEGNKGLRVDITVGDLRRARSALALLSKGSEQSTGQGKGEGQ